MKWIKQNIIPLLIILGYLTYDNFHMIFKGVEITWFQTEWTVQDYIYKFGDYLFSAPLLALIIIYLKMPKQSDSKVLIFGMMLVTLKDLIGKIIEFTGYEIDFFNNYVYNLGWIYKTALPISLIIICFLGRYIGKKWILRYV